MRIIPLAMNHAALARAMATGALIPPWLGACRFTAPAVWHAVRPGPTLAFRVNAAPAFSAGFRAALAGAPNGP